MKAEITITLRLSDTETFSIVGTGLDQDDEEFLKDVRKLIEKKEAVRTLWRGMLNEKTKPVKD